MSYFFPGPRMTHNLNSTTVLYNTTQTTVEPINLWKPESQQEPEPIFLQTKLAQGIAGAFVWVALFLTCQQVGLSLNILLMV